MMHSGGMACQPCVEDNNDYPPEEAIRPEFIKKTEARDREQSQSKVLGSEADLDVYFESIQQE